jgi:plasmid stabilization system protein ParE
VIYRLEIRPDAVIDIEQTIQWYDQRESGLGAEFRRQVLNAIDKLQQNPLAYRLRHRRKNVRWKLLDKFPYRVVFQTTEGLITVVSVVHSARHDRHWRVKTK